MHPDYWVEIPAGEFLTGLSETHRDHIRTRIRDQVNIQRFSTTQRQRLESAVAKIRRGPKRPEGVANRYEFNDEELVLIQTEPFRTITHLEITLASLPLQTTIWLDRFYIARFPITKTQLDIFRKGKSASELPGALEGPATRILDDSTKPEIRELIQSMRGQDMEYSTRLVADLQYDKALHLCQELGARLPNLLEWEKAARGMDGRLYPWGNEWDEEAGYFYRGQSTSMEAYRVDAYPRGVSPYGVWNMVGGLPEYVLGDKVRPNVVKKDRHPKESSAAMAWFEHIVAQKGSTAPWVSLRPVLAKWPRRQWSGSQTKERSHADQPRQIQFSELPLEIASSNRSLIGIGNVNRLSPLAEIITDDAHRVGSGEKITDLAWSPEGQRIAIGDHLKIWLYRAGMSEPHSLEDCKRVVTFSPDGAILASFGADYKGLRLLNIETETDITVLKKQERFSTSLAFSPNGTILASANFAGEIRLWEVSTSSELAVFQGHSEAVEKVAFSPDGSLLASAGVDGTVRLWEVKSGTEKMVLTQQALPIYDVAFSPDGVCVAAAGADGAVRLWDVERGQERQVYRDPDRNFAASLSFSPDGQLLAVGYSNVMFKVWEVATGEVLTTIQCNMGWVIRVAFNPVGTLLATSSRTVILWGIR